MVNGNFCSVITCHFHHLLLQLPFSSSPFLSHSLPSPLSPSPLPISSSLSSHFLPSFPLFPLPPSLSGKSDPYCKLAILSRKHQGSPHVRQKDMADWQKANLIQDIVQTTVRPETLEPVWNEKMELYVQVTCMSHVCHVHTVLASFPGSSPHPSCVHTHTHTHTHTHSAIQDPKEDLLAIEIW